jgi:predicted transposase YbfD/YdcC
MQPIILEDMAAEGIVFDVGALTHYLKGVTDVRQARGQRYSLEFLLVLIILAKLAGENKPKGIADWLRLRREQLVKAFQRKRATVPAYNTIRRTLENIEDGVELQTHLNRFLKDNQPTLKADVEQFFEPPRNAPGWKPPTMPQEQACSTQAGHGRIEKRVLTVIPDETGYLDWPGVAQVFKLERTVTQETTQKTTQETIYGITSLAKTRTSAHQLLEMTQQYWGIENGLHYQRDVTLEEDATRITDDRRAETMAILNNLIIGLANKLGFRNLASAQRTFEARLTFALAGCT